MTQWQPQHDRRWQQQPDVSQFNRTGLPPWTGPRRDLADPAYRPPQPQAPPRPRRPRLLVPLSAAAAVVVVILGAGAWMLSARHSAPQSCAQQYAAWKTGSGKPESGEITADINALTAAGKASDVKKMDEALGRIGTDATADEAHPMPACADPAGYWPQILAAMQAAGDNASATPGLGGLLTAEAPLKPVTGLESKLHAELERTTTAAS